MKRREIILDFTSLLDVILIILFMVLCSMNMAAQEDAEEMEALAAQNSALTEQTAELTKQTEELTEQSALLEERAETAEAKVTEAESELERLNTENAQLKESEKFARETAQKAEERMEELENISGLNEVDRAQFELFQESVDRIELYCVKKNAATCTLTIMKNDVQMETLTVGTTAMNSADVEGYLHNCLTQVEQDIAILSFIYQENTIPNFIYIGIQEIIGNQRSMFQNQFKIWYEEIVLLPGVQ